MSDYVERTLKLIDGKDHGERFQGRCEVGETEKSDVELLDATPGQ